jgi:hypothetical protein
VARRPVLTDRKGSIDMNDTEAKPRHMQRNRVAGIMLLIGALLVLWTTLALLICGALFVAAATRSVLLDVRDAREREDLAQADMNIAAWRAAAPSARPS